MKNKKQTGITTVTYGDPLSLLFLWQKAFMMMPLWGLPLIAVVGLFCRFMGSTAMDVGFGALVCFFLVYFLEDSLKRKIRIDDQNIFFGYRAIPIKDIISLEVGNKKNKILPAHLVIYNRDGKKFKLRFDALSDHNVDSFIAHLKSRNSQIEISPVLGALIKARRAPQLPAARPERLELAYQAGPIVSESIAAYRSTAGQWIRVGPILVSLVAAPMWLGIIGTIFSTLHPHAFNGSSQFALQTFLTQCSIGLSHAVYQGFADGTKGLANVTRNMWAIGLMSLCVSAMLFYIQRIILRPNSLILDKKRLTMALRLGALSIPLQRLQWDTVKQLELSEGANNITNIAIDCGRKKPVKLNLSAIEEDERNLVLKRFEEYVPDCKIEHQVAQSLMPRSEHSYTELWLQSLSEAPEKQTLDPLEPGQVVGGGQFEVLHSLGVGGQGTAYLCRTKYGDQNLVVLKETILPVFVDHAVRRQALETFEKEAKLLNELKDPGIVQLIDYFVQDHRAYLVMEHLAGDSLRKVVLRDGPMAEVDTIVLVEQMCDILQFLHSKGVVHRDFTPDNLIFDSHGKIKLIDFNVAQQAENGSQGAIVGKPAYMPPEQFRGKATTQSDLYAMGATLFFLLTGEDPEPISQSSPKSKNSNISTAFDTMVKKATAMQTKNRYETVDEIRADLAKLQLSEKEEAIQYG